MKLLQLWQMLYVICAITRNRLCLLHNTTVKFFPKPSVLEENCLYNVCNWYRVSIISIYSDENWAVTPSSNLSPCNFTLYFYKNEATTSTFEIWFKFSAASTVSISAIKLSHLGKSVLINNLCNVSERFLWTYQHRLCT